MTSSAAKAGVVPGGPARPASRDSANPAAGEDAVPVLDLSLNEGAPPPRERLEDLAARDPRLLAKYPDPAPLEAAYAEHLRVDPACVLATTGGDDAIDRVLRAFISPGQEFVFPAPTFEVIPRCARMAGAKLVPVEYEWGASPRRAVAGAVSAKTAVAAVVSPNNPTGCAMTERDLTGLAEELPEHVVLMADLAYAEFADHDPVQALLGRPRVVTIRTLSKAWGMAGLRVGFALGSPERIAALRRFGGPFPVSGPAVAVAAGELRQGRRRMRAFVASVRRRRDRLAALLERAGGEPVPSQANFVLARFAGTRWIDRGLAAQGVRVRLFDGLPDCARVAVPANDADFQRLERAAECLRRPQALLFDMDGVLANVRRSYRGAIVAACESFGVAVGPAEIDAAKAKGDANDDWALTRLLLRRAGVPVPLAQVRDRFEEVYQGTEDAPGLRRFETLVPPRSWLEELAGRFPLGVVTGRPRRDAERFLAEHELRELFGVVICREDAPLKPDPAPVALAMRRLQAATAWMFGDTPDDILAARGAGAVPVGVVPPGAARIAKKALEDAGAARIVDAGEAGAWSGLGLAGRAPATEGLPRPESPQARIPAGERR